MAASDYGSDAGFDELDEDTILAGVLGDIRDSGPAQKSAILPSIEFAEGELEDEAHDVDVADETSRSALLRKAKHTATVQGDVQSSPVHERTAFEVEYDERSRRTWSVPLLDTASSSRGSRTPFKSDKTDADRALSTHEAVDLSEANSRPPLERFRTKPKKPLSVTDLVSPAWCELQYLYTLSKFGRKPRTQAMRTGSKIHQKLEDEVHSTVPVQVKSKEDRFGLRLWNTISGLRCLRETGLTRELEVWGVIHGQVVNGVIDEVSYTCPDSDFEKQFEVSQAEKNGGVVPLPPNQPSILDAFSCTTESDAGFVAGSQISETDRQIYIADVKTRSVQNLPTGASLRPTWMQLMLYRKLLESLSLNTVDAETVLVRYDLSPLEPFTDTFMSELGGLHEDSETSNYPNLLSLWSLLVTEMQITLAPEAISPILRAEFRYARTGSVIGSKLTVYDTDTIEGYIDSEMAWWKGQRQAKGVEIEEAFKCRICDFSEDCSWRKTKVEEAIEKSRLRQQARDKSAV